ncbi:MAG: 50S ribosomal protein L11 [Spirochaetales bacterium]
MAKKVKAIIKLQLPAGKATPGQSVGSALGPHGIATMEFLKQFNDRTKGQEGMIIPVVVTAYEDRSFTFITKTPPAAMLIKKACGIEKGSAAPHKDKVAKITKAQLKEIAELKMQDLNAGSVEAAIKVIAGSARSMGVTVVEE